eukprot:2073284-Amphidinium_carterae.1
MDRRSKHARFVAVVGVLELVTNKTAALAWFLFGVLLAGFHGRSCGMHAGWIGGHCARMWLWDECGIGGTHELPEEAFNWLGRYCKPSRGSAPDAENGETEPERTVRRERSDQHTNMGLGRAWWVEGTNETTSSVWWLLCSMPELKSDD